MRKRGNFKEKRMALQDLDSGSSQSRSQCGRETDAGVTVPDKPFRIALTRNVVQQQHSTSFNRCPPFRCSFLLRNPYRVLLLASILLLLPILLIVARYFLSMPLTIWQQNVFSMSDDGGSGSVAANAMIDADSPSSNPLMAPDALIVLGCSVNHYTGELSRDLHTRVERAVELACEHQSTVHLLIMSGGSSNAVPVSLPTESELMTVHFVRLWQQSPCRETTPPRIMTERTSTSTLLNARHSLQMLTRYIYRVGTVMHEVDGSGAESSGTSPSPFTSSSTASSSPPVPIRHVMIVTSRYHQYRSFHTFMRVEEERRRESKVNINHNRCETEKDCTMHQHAQHGTVADGSADDNPESEWIFTTLPSCWSHLSTHPPFILHMASMPLSRSHHVRQFDFIRECLALVLYWTMGWM